MNVNQIRHSESGTQTDAPCTTAGSPSSTLSPIPSTSLQSSFSFVKPATTGLMHSHLASLLDQCREALTLASQHQHRQEEYIRKLHFSTREELGTLKQKLEHTTSMLVQEREAHALSRDSFLQVKAHFERERDAQKNATSAIEQELAQLRSDLAEERKHLQDEKLKSQKLLAEQISQAKLLHQGSELVQQLRYDLSNEKQHLKDEKLVSQTSLAERIAQAKDLAAEQQKNERLRENNTEAKRRLVTFHFGANILTSYFWAMLHDNKIQRISAKRKAVEDVHDLWDVQTALKRLVDGCTSLVENIPDRQDFYDDAECPLCLSGMSSQTSATPSDQVLSETSMKLEPMDICLSRPSCHNPF